MPHSWIPPTRERESCLTQAYIPSPRQLISNDYWLMQEYKDLVLIPQSGTTINSYRSALVPLSNEPRICYNSIVVQLLPIPMPHDGVAFKLLVCNFPFYNLFPWKPDWWYEDSWCQRVDQGKIILELDDLPVNWEKFLSWTGVWSSLNHAVLIQLLKLSIVNSHCTIVEQNTLEGAIS